jgi:hypothetical protein
VAETIGDTRAIRVIMAVPHRVDGMASDKAANLVLLYDTIRVVVMQLLVLPSKADKKRALKN